MCLVVLFFPAEECSFAPHSSFGRAKEVSLRRAPCSEAQTLVTYERRHPKA